LIINAVGYLHDKTFLPEKKISEISNEYLLNCFKLNSIGHALIIKYFTPLFNQETKSFLICLSARVGSITDNYLGGWFGYRASKAALNQIVKSASIEINRNLPNLILASIHPGTVYTKLSKPFIKESKCFSTNESAKKILKTIFKLEKEDSGKLLDYHGKVIPF
jgi:NAD(P)-dependent dehydrogenase (short-subunit alcohol dehydrogenase family)